MKKKILLISVIAAVALILVLFLPIPRSAYDDGGTRVYTTLTYKIVKWHRMLSVYGEDGVIARIDIYDDTAVYWFPDNFKQLDELWEVEREKDN